MKKIIFILLLGFFVGAAVAGLISPSMVAWYFDPPAVIGVSCKDAVVWGIGSYQKLIFVGGILGFLLAIAFIIFRQFKSKSSLK